MLSASGIGDIIVRLKNRVYSGGSGLAWGMDLRLPTGDAENLLGSGALGLKPFVAVSFNNEVVSPHFNLGYQWNGKSILAGDVLAGEKAELPDQLVYAVGLDIGVSARVTAGVRYPRFEGVRHPATDVGDFHGARSRGNHFCRRLLRGSVLQPDDGCRRGEGEPRG